jgi:hypothetical protein
VRSVNHPTFFALCVLVLCAIALAVSGFFIPAEVVAGDGGAIPPPVVPPDTTTIHCSPAPVADPALSDLLIITFTILLQSGL